VSTNKNTFAVVGLSTPGPKATKVGLRSLDTTDEIRYSAWIANALVASVVAGMRVTFGAVSLGKTETEYTNHLGEVVALKFPKKQVFWGGDITFDAPATEPLPAQGQVIMTPAAQKFAAAVLAKQAREANLNTTDELALGSDEPF